MYMRLPELEGAMFVDEIDNGMHVQCVVLACVVLVLRYLLFAWPVHLGLYCWCREKN